MADLSYLIDNPPRICVDGQEGPVVLRTKAGAPLDERLSAVAWKYGREDYADQLRDALQERRVRIEQLGLLHHSIPPPSTRPSYLAAPFEESAPESPSFLAYHWFWELFASHRRRIDATNEALRSEHATEMQEWGQRKREHEGHEATCQQMYAERDTDVPERVEAFLTWHFEKLDWPQETAVAFDLSADGETLSFDIDLPEIENFPAGYQEANAKADAVRWKKLTDAARRQLYMAHVHGVGLRLTGEGFAHAQGVKTVVVAGFSQRPNKQTGAIEDQYLYSARISREAWQGIDFQRLSDLDPVAAFERFDLRRKVTKTGIFTPIAPHESPAA